jgi:hypothetical protein
MFYRYGRRQLLTIRLGSVLVVAALAASLWPSCSSGSPITFQRTYGGADDDICNWVRQTDDGGYIMVGTAASFGTPCWLVKTDQRGDTQWTRTPGGSTGWGGDVEQTADSGYIIAGSTITSLDTLGDAWLVKTDARGDTLWTRTYGDTLYNYFDAVALTTDGGYVAVGITASFGLGSGDIWLVKTDSKGDTSWTRTFGGTNDDEGYSVQQTNDGGYIIAGATWSYGAGGADAYLIKTDAAGDTQWTRTFGGPLDDFGDCARQTRDGGYVVGGRTMSYPDSSVYIWLIKTNANGDTLWTRKIGKDSGFADGGQLEQLDDGGYMIAGSVARDFYDVYLVRTDSNGDTLWTRAFGGSNLDLGYSVQGTSDGGFIVGGQTYSFGAGKSDFYLIKTDANGNAAVAEPKSGLPHRATFALSCAPNPFHSSTVLHLTTGPLDHSATQLRVYDVQGRLVRALTISRETQAVWDGRDNGGRPLPSGTYLAHCDTAGKHATTRLVLQR